jgi:hypothetical protein
MGGVDRRKWEVARTAVASIIRIAPPNVPIALIAFSNKVRKTFDFDENRLTIMDWLAEVRGERKEDLFGRTMLFDSISAADKMLEPHREGDAIYAITDGGDSGSNLNSKKLENQLLRHRVRLFAFLLDEPFAPKEELAQQQNFLQIVVNTGGFTFGASSDQMLSSAGGPRYRLDIPARERIEAQTELLVAQIGGIYRLDIRPTQALPDESRISLELVNDKGKRRKDVIVLFPRRLMRCPDGAIANN